MPALCALPGIFAAMGRSYRPQSGQKTFSRLHAASSLACSRSSQSYPQPYPRLPWIDRERRN